MNNRNCCDRYPPSLIFLTVLIYGGTVAAICRAEEPQPDNGRPRPVLETNNDASRSSQSAKETVSLGFTEFFAGTPPTGKIYRDAPDGPALINYTSLQRRLFVDPPKLDEPQESMARFYVNLFYLSHADFKLAGQVVDEAMQPVRDVQMTVKAAQLTNIWTGGKQIEIVRQKLADGAFSIELKGYCEVEVAFKKEGLRSEVYKPQLAGPDPKDVNIDRLLQRERPKIRQFAQEQLRIVLAKPKPTENLYYDWPTLIWRGDESGVVADFGQMFGGKGFGRKVGNLRATDRLPPGCLMFLPQQDADGNVVLDGDSDDALPASVELRVNDKNSGLQLLASDNEPRSLVHIVEAPQEGYAAKLTLSSKQLREHAYFFVRTRDRYAKCRIESAKVTRDVGLEIAIVVAIKYQRRATRYMNEIP